VAKSEARYRRVLAPMSLGSVVKFSWWFFLVASWSNKKASTSSGWPVMLWIASLSCEVFGNDAPLKRKKSVTPPYFYQRQ